MAGDGTDGGRADERYFQAIEDHFSRLRGTPLLLSTRDVALIDDWWRAGIPLRIVLAAIERVFARRAEAAGRGPVSSLRYCRHAVEEAFTEWREARLGEAGEPGAPPPAPAEAAGFLEARAAEIEGRALPALREAAAALRRLAATLRGDDPPSLSRVEEELARIEDRLVESLLGSMPAAEREALEQRAVARVAPLRARLTGRAWDASLEGQRRAEVRAAFRLPRLTLYLL
jgi:hypothetical protein